MQIRVRVTSATVTPSDSSGFIVEAEVADAEQFVDDILRRPDDGEDCWPLGKRYDEIVKEAHALRERVAELEAEIERMAETHNAASQSEHDVIREQLQRAEHERDDYRLRWEESQRQWGDRVDDCGDLAERLRRAEEAARSAEMLLRQSYIDREEMVSSEAQVWIDAAERKGAQCRALIRRWRAMHHEVVDVLLRYADEAEGCEMRRMAERVQELDRNEQAEVEEAMQELRRAKERAEKAERERDEARALQEKLRRELRDEAWALAEDTVGEARSERDTQRARAEAGEALLRAVRGDLKETERYCFMPYDGETDLHGDVWKELRDERIEAIDAHLAAHSPDTAGGGEGV